MRESVRDSVLEETAPRIKHSPDVDEVGGFGRGNVRLGSVYFETLLGAAAATVGLALLTMRTNPALANAVPAEVGIDRGSDAPLLETAVPLLDIWGHGGWHAAGGLPQASNRDRLVFEHGLPSCLIY